MARNESGTTPGKHSLSPDARNARTDVGVCLELLLRAKSVDVCLPLAFKGGCLVHELFHGYAHGLHLEFGLGFRAGQYCLELVELYVGLGEFYVGLSELRLGRVELHLGLSERHLGLGEFYVRLGELHLGLGESYLGLSDGG